MITWCFASLGIYSKKLSEKEIEYILGAEPSRRTEKGDKVIVRGEVMRLREESVWTLDSPLDHSESVESHLEHLLGFAEAKAGKLRSLAAECDFAIYVSFITGDHQGGFTLDEQMLKRLAELNIRLEVSSFGNRDEQEEN